jgi:hypothetical protein
MGETSGFHITHKGDPNPFVVLAFLNPFHLHGASVEANSIVLNFKVADLFKDLLIMLWIVLVAGKEVGIPSGAVSLLCP